LPADAGIVEDYRLEMASDFFSLQLQQHHRAEDLRLIADNQRLRPSSIQILPKTHSAAGLDRVTRPPVLADPMLAFSAQYRKASNYLRLC
jgi:hypothetical protein